MSLTGKLARQRADESSIGWMRPDIGISGLNVPNRIQVMGVVSVARDDVPVDMRDAIPEACHVHLVGLLQTPQRGFDGIDHAHEPVAFADNKVRHLAHMPIQDHAVNRIAAIFSPDDAGEVIAPQHNAAILFAKRTVH